MVVVVVVVVVLLGKAYPVMVESRRGVDCLLRARHSCVCLLCGPCCEVPSVWVGPLWVLPACVPIVPVASSLSMPLARALAPTVYGLFTIGYLSRANTRVLSSCAPRVSFNSI